MRVGETAVELWASPPGALPLPGSAPGPASLRLPSSASRDVGQPADKHTLALQREGGGGGAMGPKAAQPECLPLGLGGSCVGGFCG